jgi:hypothetical protein
MGSYMGKAKKKPLPRKVQQLQGTQTFETYPEFICFQPTPFTIHQSVKVSGYMTCNFVNEETRIILHTSLIWRRACICFQRRNKILVVIDLKKIARSVYSYTMADNKEHGLIPTMNRKYMINASDEVRSISKSRWIRCTIKWELFLFELKINPKYGLCAFWTYLQTHPRRSWRLTGFRQRRQCLKESTF